MPLNIARLSPAEGGGFSAEGLGRARWLVLSNGLDAGGRSATDVAVDVLAVLVLGAGADQMGVLMTLSGLGFLVFGVPIGIMVDRRLSPVLLSATGIAKAALLSTLVLAWAVNALTFFHLAAVMCLLGVLTVLAETTQTTLVPRVAPPAHVPRLAARLESADAALGLIVPAAAGLAVAKLGSGPVLALSAAFLLAAGLVALKVRMISPAQRESAKSGIANAEAALSRWARFWRDAVEGWSVLRSAPALWLLALSGTASNLGMSLFVPVEAVWILTDLRMGPEFLGFQLTAGSAGALVIAAIASRCISVLGDRGCILTGSFGCAAAVGLHLMAYVDRSHAGVYLLAGSALWGFMVVLNNITQATVFARACPEGTLGRVTALRRMLTRGAVPFGTLAGGAMGAAFGTWWALLGWQILAVVSLALSSMAFRHLSKAPTHTS
ncbi:MFS transporter [Kocuria sp. KSNUG]|uniref:MFS transporter n=1 Tax=Kocuria sp. KSNUG TaxID=3136676 RepID=UPI003C2AD08A